MTTHAIKLTTSDGGLFEFVGEDSETLLDAAARANIILPSMCRQGSCGICTVTCTSGDYKLENYNSVVLSAEAAAEGDILPCRTYPRSDLQLLAPYESVEVRTRTLEERVARIVEMETVATNTVRLRLRIEPTDGTPAAIDFEPGQYMQIAVPGSEVWRAYSLSNTANWEGALEFYIRLRPGGVFSEFLTTQFRAADAQAGATLRVRGPQGGFHLRQNGARPRWFIAGGTGLAPVMSMLRRMAEYQEPQEARLFFGVNSEDELFGLEELERIRKELRGVAADVRVWRPSPEWRGLTGTPVDGFVAALATVLGQTATTANGVAPDVYLCGPAPLVEAGRNAALAAGVPPEQIFSERFLAG